MLREGLLDTLVICAVPDDAPPRQTVNFRYKDAFQDPRLCDIQTKKFKKHCAGFWPVRRQGGQESRCGESDEPNRSLSPRRYPVLQYLHRL